MRLRASMVWVAAIGLLLGCEETRATFPVIIRGTNDITLANELLFITASDANELRVVDLTLRVPDFVRAPNPLSPLSIPVAERPMQLGRDTIWDDQGRPVGGRYVYALSANARQISIVGAARESLVQLAVLNADQLTIDGLVPPASLTAVAGTGSGGNSRVFVAAYDPPNSTIYEIDVPEENLTDATLAPGGKLQIKAKATFSCGAILSMVVLPGDALAYGGRRTPEVTGCETTDPTATAEVVKADGTTVPLAFGVPVRKLFANPRAPGSPNFEQGFAEGERIYGVIDEQACVGPTGCRGALAVVGPNTTSMSGCNATVGAIACGPSGRPMLPVDVGNALIMGADVTASGSIAIVTGEGSNVLNENPSRLQGVLTTSDGRMVFWDAGNLRHYDVDDAPATAEAVIQFNPDGTPVISDNYIEGPVQPTIVIDPETGKPVMDPVTKGPLYEKHVIANEGITRDEVISLIYLGNLPGLTGMVLPGNATTLDVPVDPTGEVEVGDLVYGLDAATCPGTATVSALAAKPEGGGTLTLSGPLGAVDCAVAVRPADGSSLPWVAQGSLTGFLGRFAPGTGIELPATQERRAALYYRYPASLTPGAPLPPLLLMDFKDPGATAPAALVRGLRYDIEMAAHFQRAEVVVSSSSAAATNVLRVDVAGAAMYRQTANELMVAFPAGEAVLRFGVGNLIAGTATTEGLEIPFR